MPDINDMTEKVKVTAQTVKSGVDEVKDIIDTVKEVSENGQEMMNNVSQTVSTMQDTTSSTSILSNSFNTNSKVYLWVLTAMFFICAIITFFLITKYKAEVQSIFNTIATVYTSLCVTLTAKSGAENVTKIKNANSTPSSPSN